MEKEQGLEILKQAINAGVVKGIYSLEDMKLILEALEVVSK
jgi:hypothetical protein